MVAIFTGLGSGFERGSGAMLGAAGFLGSGVLGRSGEQVSLNAATGNLLITQQDEFLIGKGPDSQIARTYNSLGNLSDDNGDNWRQSTDRRVFGLTGTQDTAGSTITRASADGSEIVYSWQTIGGVSAYWTTDGAGTYDKLSYASGVWTWTDGDTQATEKYALYGTNNWRITEAADTVGNKLSFTYTGANLTQVTTQDGAYEQYSWSGSNITQIVTGYTDLVTSTAKTLTRTRYGYDGSNRLTSVTVDLSPGDNSIADGKTYVTTYTYDGTSRRVASIAQTDGSLLAIIYDSGTGKVLTLTQTIASGVTRVTSISYQSGYTNITDPGGQVTRLDYDGSNRLTKITAPPTYSGATAQVTQFAYNGNGDLTSITDAAGAVSSFTYSATGAVLTATDPLSNVVTRTYGAKNELLTETRTGSDNASAAASHTMRYVYDANDLLRFEIDAEGRVAEHRYNSAGQEVLKIGYPDQAFDLTSYSSSTAPSEATMAAWAAAITDLTNTEQTVTDYDARGNVLKVTSFSTIAAGGGGASTAVAIDAGTNTTITANGDGTYSIQRTTGGFLGYSGDARSTTGVSGDFVVQVRPQSVNEYAVGVSTSPASSTALANLNYSFWMLGDGSLNYAEGGSTGSLGASYAAGDNFWLVRSGTTLSYYAGATLSAAMAGTALRTVTGVTGTFYFDTSHYTRFAPVDAAFSSAIPTTPATPLDTRITNFVYDQSGRLLSRGTPGLGTETMVYDGLGRVTASTDLAGATTSIVFTDSSTQTVVTLANGFTTTSVYNKAGELLTTVESGSYVTGGTETSAYDQRGQLRIFTDATGHNSYSIYDLAGRKTADIDHYGSIVEYRYDADNRLIYTVRYVNRVTAGQLTTLGNPSSTIDIATLRPTANAGDLSTRKVYDADGRVIETIGGDGSVTTLAYDGSSRLVATTTWFNKLTSTQLSGFLTTPPTGAVTPTADSRDSVARIFYDKAGLVLGTLDGEGYLTRSTFDKAGRKTVETLFATATSAGLRATGTFDQLVTSAGTSAADRTTRYVYDGQGQLRYQIDPLNQVTEYNYDTGTAGQSIGLVRLKTQYYGTLSTLSSYTYAAVKAAVVALSGHPFTRYSSAIYDSANRLAYSIDPLGAVVGYTYDSTGNLIKTTVNANSHGVTTSVLDLATMNAWAAANTPSTNRVTRNYYSARGDLMYQVDGEGFVTGFTYDAEGRVLTRTQWNTAISVTDSTTIATVASLATGTSAVTTTAYDMDGNVSDLYDAEGNRHSYVYNANGTLSLDILSYGQADETRTAYVYDAAARVTGTYKAYGQPEQTFTQYSYDGFGNVLTVTDPRNNVTTRTYDHAGQLLTETDPLSGVTSYQYNAFGEVVKATDVRGYSTYSYYDVAGRVTAARDAEDYVTESSYTPFGQVASVTRRANKATNTASVSTLPSYTADAVNDATTSYVYDKAGRLQQTTDANGFQSGQTYNSFGETLYKVAGYATQSAFYYDRRGLVTTKSDTIAVLTPYGTQYAPSVTNYEYDARGNLTKKTEAAGEAEQRITSFTYDKINRLTDTSLPAVLNATNTANVTPVEHLKYDGRGNVIEKDDAAGGRTLYWYDHLDRVVSQLGPTGTLTEYGYDKNGNVLSLRVYATQVALPALPGGARPSSVAGDTYRETIRTYDALNRLLTQSMASIRVGAWNGSTYATSVTTLTTINQYDAAGNLVKVTDPGGGLTYSYYDKLGRMTAQVDALGYMTAWTYTAAGKVQSERRYATAATGVTVGTPPSVSTNAADRVTNYTYDRVGNMLTEQRTGVVSWTIASNGALTSVPSGTSTVTYTYNGFGEVLTKAEATGDTTTYSYDNNGWLMQESHASYATASGTVTPSVRYFYNYLGDVVRIGQGDATAGAGDRITNYSYGAGGRLQTTTDAAGNVRTYYYDIAGRKVGEQYARVDSAGTTHQEGTSYQYDLAGNVVRQAFGTVSGGTFTDAGEITSLAYNAYGEVTSRSIKGAGAASFVVQEQMAYDAAGRVWRSNAGDGVWRFFIYDANGNQTAAIESEGTDLSGKTISQVLDIATVSGTSTVGATYIDGINATIATYDARNQALSAIATKRQLGTGSPQDIVQSQGYNAFGEVAWDRDARVSAPDYSNVYTYNTMGRLISVQHAKVTVGNADGTTTANATPTDTYYYDISGRMIGQVDANGYVAKRTLLAGTGYDKADGLVSTEFHADTGTVVSSYNVYGDLVSVQGEITARPASTMIYDAMGRLTEYAHNGLTDYYSYDVLGQRIKHWNSFLGGSNVEKTDYDVQGRVISQVAYGGDTTTTSYSWDGTLVTTGLSATAFGGYTKTTTFANGKTAIEKSDGFGHAVSKTDLGGHVTSITYDMAGRLTENAGGQTQQFTYLNTGLAARISTGTGSGGGFVETQRSDFTYYASGDKFTEVSTIGGVTVQNATATYDTRGRMLGWTETGNATNPYATISWTYDAAGNIRRETATFTPLSATGGTLSQVSQDNWFRYDAMNHVVTANGIVVSGQIVRGYTGTDITYNLAGDRATVTNTVTGVGKVRREDYSYDTSGNLSQVAVAEATYTDNGNGTVTVSLPGTGDIKSTYTYDAMSRLTRQQDWTGNGSGVAVDRQVTYNGAGQISIDNLSQKQGTDTYVSVTTNTYGSGSGYALGAVVSASITNTKNGTTQPTSSTSNTFLWYDGAAQWVTSYKPDVTQSATNTTTYSYNGAGIFTSASIADGRPRTVTATNDALGQVIRRDESNGVSTTGFPHEVWYRFNGRQLGHVGNNGTLETDYRSSIDMRTAASAGTGNFRNGASSGSTAAEFGSGYDPFTSYEQASQLSTYTARSGDTLASIAAQIWGDASLWYKLASANGLSGSSELTAGQTIVIPAGVTRTTNTASTFTPYDPSEAIGDTSPTTPKPQAKKNKCGAFGMILLAVVALAVATVLTAGVASIATGATFSTSLSAVLGGSLATLSAAGGAALGAMGAVGAAAIGAIGGSIVSQALGVATGIQDKFSWKAVALAGIGSFVGGTIGANFGGGGALGAVGRAVAGSAITQGIGVATGLQPKFSWVGVAAAGVTAGVTSLVSGALHFNPKLQGFHPGNSLVGAAASMAGKIAGAATRSILDGSDFGDNVLKAVPEVVAQFLFSLGKGLIQQAALDRAKQAREAVVDLKLDQALRTAGQIAADRGNANQPPAPVDPRVTAQAEAGRISPQAQLTVRRAQYEQLSPADKAAYDARALGPLAPVNPNAPANNRVLAGNDAFNGASGPTDGRNIIGFFNTERTQTMDEIDPKDVVGELRNQQAYAGLNDKDFANAFATGTTFQRAVALPYLQMGAQYESEHHIENGIATQTLNAVLAKGADDGVVHWESLRLPDTYSANVSVAIPKLSDGGVKPSNVVVGVGLTVTRHGNIYYTFPTQGVGASPKGYFSANANVGWVDQNFRPSQTQLDGIVNGTSDNVSGGWIVGASHSWNNNGSITSWGITTPGIDYTTGEAHPLFPDR